MHLEPGVLLYCSATSPALYDLKHVHVELIAQQISVGRVLILQTSFPLHGWRGLGSGICEQQSSVTLL